MHAFIKKYRQILSVCFSVTVSVFLVAIVVSAATTIGTNITTGGNVTITGGAAATGTLAVGTSGTVQATSTIYHGLELGTRTGYTKGVFSVNPSGNVSASGTIEVGSHVLPLADATSNLGSQSFRFLNYYGSGNLTASTTLVIGTSATVAATSTIYHGLELGNRTGYTRGVFNVDTLGNVSASGTLRVGRSAATSTVNFSTYGGASGKGTCIVLTSMDGTLMYLSVSSTANAATPWTGILLSTTTCLE